MTSATRTTLQFRTDDGDWHTLPSVGEVSFKVKTKGLAFKLASTYSASGTIRLRPALPRSKAHRRWQTK
jgi:hypothetical protein